MFETVEVVVVVGLRIRFAAIPSTIKKSIKRRRLLLADKRPYLRKNFFFLTFVVVYFILQCSYEK